MVARFLFCRLGETLYAYGNSCPGCGKALQGAQLEVTNLVCPHWRTTIRRDTCGPRTWIEPNLHLEPFPLLFEQGRARVALPPL